MEKLANFSVVLYLILTSTIPFSRQKLLLLLEEYLFTQLYILNIK